MPHKPDQPYNLEQAQEEAAKLQEKIKSGEAKTYTEAEELVEKEKEPRPVRVVIADDDPRVLEMAKRAFGLVKQEGENQEETERKERRRIELNTTTNPAEVLKMIESDNPPDIIFTDLIFEGKNDEIHEKYLKYVAEVERLIKEGYINKLGYRVFAGLGSYYKEIALPMVRSMKSGKADLEHVYKALNNGYKLKQSRNNPEERKKVVEEIIEEFMKQRHFGRLERLLREEEERCRKEGKDPNKDRQVRAYKTEMERKRRILDDFRRAFEIIEKMERGEEIDVKEEYPYGALIFQEAKRRRIDAKIVTDLFGGAVRDIDKFSGKPLWELGILILPLVVQGFIERKEKVGAIIYSARNLEMSSYKKPNDDPDHFVTEDESINRWRYCIEDSIKEVAKKETV